MPKMPRDGINSFEEKVALVIYIPEYTVTVCARVSFSVNFSTPSALIIYLCSSSASSFGCGHFSHIPQSHSCVRRRHSRSPSTSSYLKKFFRCVRGRESSLLNRSVLCSLKQFMHVLWITESDRKCLNVVLILKPKQTQADCKQRGGTH